MRALRRVVTQTHQALDGLEALLNAIDAADEEAAAQGHPEWTPLIALPRLLFQWKMNHPEKPEIYDPKEAFNIATMPYDTLFDGDWEQYIAWTETQGGAEQRTQDMPILRSLQEFERRYGVDLSDLLFNETDRFEHDLIRLEYARRVTPEWSPDEN